MKHFGKFLLEKKCLDDHELLGSLISQLESIPTTAKVVFEKRLLSDADQIEILELQSKSATSYRTAAKSLNKWSETIEKEVEDYVFEHKKSLIQILFENQSIDTQTLVTMVDEFMADQDPAEVAVLQKKIEISSCNAPAGPIEAMQPSTNTIYLSVDDDFFSKVALKIELLGDLSGPSFQATCDDIKQDLDSVFRNSQTNAANESGIQLLSALKTAMDCFSMNENNSESIVDLANTAADAITVLRRMANHTNSGGTETSYFDDPSFREDYDAIIKYLDELTATAIKVS